MLPVGGFAVCTLPAFPLLALAVHSDPHMGFSGVAFHEHNDALLMFLKFIRFGDVILT